MKKYFLILFLTTLHGNEDKLVIGTWPHGFFSAFFSVIHSLNWCNKHNKTPVVCWDKGSYYYVPEKFNGSDNVWEYYFEPVSNLTYSEADKQHIEYGAPDGSVFEALNPTLQDRINANKIIKQYIKIKPNIQEKINNFYKKHMEGKKTIGIHMRGTDKVFEIKPVHPQKFFKKANQYKGYQFLVATDELKLLQDALKNLKGKVIFYPCFRSTNKVPIHCKSPNKAQVGEDVLVEAVLLSKCDKLIHSISNVSTASLFFNPDLEDILLTEPTKKPKENQLNSFLGLKLKKPLILLPFLALECYAFNR